VQIPGLVLIPGLRLPLAAPELAQWSIHEPGREALQLFHLTPLTMVFGRRWLKPGRTTTLPLDMQPQTSQALPGVDLSAQEQYAQPNHNHNPPG